MSRELGRRRLSPKKLYEFDTIKFVLFYLPEEHKYLHLSTASTLCPRVDYEKVAPLKAFELSDKVSEFPAIYICHTDSKPEIEIRMNFLQKYIDSGKLINARNKYAFPTTKLLGRR